jgi:DNA-binding beta-propeller fold protein YncE
VLRRHKLAGIIVLALVAALAAAVTSGRAGANPIVATVTIGQSRMPLLPALDTRTGRAFFWQWNAGDMRVLDVLDVSTGTLLKTVAIDLATMAMDEYDLVVNEQLGRVFTVSVPTTSLTLNVYVGRVIALDARTGRLLYRTPVTLGGTMNSMAVDTRARRVFVLGFPNYLPGGVRLDPVRDAVRLSILDATSGHLVRSLRLRPERQTGPGDDFSVGPPLAVDTRTNRLYVSAFDRSSIDVFDASSGRLLRSVALPHFAPTQGVTLMGSAILVNERLDRVYVTNTTQGPETLTTLDASTGRVLHAVRLNRGSTPVIDAATQRVFVANGASGRMLVLDAMSGRQIGTVGTGVTAQPWLRPQPWLVVDEHSGRIVELPGGGATVNIRDGTTERLLHTVTVGSNPAGVAIDEQNGCIFVTTLGPTDQMRGPTGTGSLEVVDERTGTLVRTVPVGMAPYFVALDGPAGRALVFNAGGGTVRVPNPWSWVPPWLRRVLPFLPPGVPRTRTVPASVTIIDISHL